MATKSNAYIARGTYGEITDSAIVAEGRALIAQAVAAKKLKAEFFERHSSKRATALNYDIYDRLGGQWLVQQRQTKIDKYGVHPVKYYYLLRRVGRGIEMTEVINKATANRAAKQSVRLGDAIRVLRGELKLRGAKRGPVEPKTAYKAVAVVDGQYRSIYDNKVVYHLGRTLVQKARPHHEGGYYVYRTEREARRASVPERSDNYDAPRVILECEVGGRCVEYDNGKIAYTRIKPMRVAGGE